MSMDTPHAVKPGKTLMIVEDEALVTMTLRDELEDAGYHVLDLTDRHEKALNIPVLFVSGQVGRAKSAKTVAIGSMPKPYSALDMVKAVD
jgi:hypothetical protein